MSESVRRNCEGFRGHLFDMARGVRMGGPDRELLQAHLGECARCQEELNAQTRLTRVMAGLGSEAVLASAAPEPGSVFFEALNSATSARRQPTRWWMAAGAVAAVVLLSWVMWTNADRAVTPTKKPLPAEANILIPPPGGTPPVLTASASRRTPDPAPRRRRTKAPVAQPQAAEQPFIAIPFTAPLGPDERADIVRMDLPVTALIAAGFPMQDSDPTASARADLVVGQDGRARAVRLLSISNSDSNRSYR